MASLIDLARRIFYHLPEPVKLLTVKSVNNLLLLLCASR
jgi:hypothetical protein